jgi:hypothetical protein
MPDPYKSAGKYSFVYFNPAVFLVEGKIKILNCIAASIPRM